MSHNRMYGEGKIFHYSLLMLNLFDFYFHTNLFHRTALHIALYQGFLDIAKFLIDSDANRISFNLQDKDGR